MKRIQFFVLKVCKHDTIICFQLNRVTLFLSPNDITDPNATKTAQVVCAMLKGIYFTNMNDFLLFLT